MGGHFSILATNNSVDPIVWYSMHIVASLSLMRSAIVSFLTFLLIVSVFANVFFFLQRQTLLSEQQRGGRSQSSSTTAIALKPQAFGTVTINVQPQNQKICADTSQAFLGDCLLSQKNATDKKPSFVVVRPVKYAYAMNPALLPPLPAALAVYRDQGIISDMASIIDALPALRTSLAQARVELAPQIAQFITADGAYSVGVHLIKREVEMRSNAKPTKYRLKLRKAELLSKQQVTDLARTFAQSFGIDPATFGTPMVFGETLSGATVTAPVPPWIDRSQQPVVQVVWPLTFDGKRVIDVDLNPVAALTVIVSQQTQSAIGLSLKLHTPRELVHSDYPVAPAAALEKSLVEGGIRPAPSATSGTLKIVSFSGSQLAYMMRVDPLAKDPTYMLPIIIFSGSLPAACDSCTTTPWETYIPATDPAFIQWK